MPAPGLPRSPAFGSLLALRGGLAILLGLASGGLHMLALLIPRITTDVMILLFGGYAGADGALGRAPL